MNRAAPKVEQLHPRTEMLVVMCLLGLAAVVIIAVIGWDWAGDDEVRTELAGWLVATGTIATVVAAVAAAVFAAGAFRLESDRQDQLRLDRRKHQAERVAAWFDWAWTERPESAYARATRVRRPVVRMRNASDLPVTDVHVTVRLAGQTLGRMTHPLVPPDQDLIEVSAEISEGLDDFNAYRDSGDANLEDLESQPCVDISFTDSGGRRWKRLHGGQLTEVRVNFT